MADKELFLFPTSYAQQRLWFLSQLEPDSAAYNIPAALRLRGPLDVRALGLSLDEIVRRHEALRTTFVAVEGKPAQFVAPELSLPLPLTDLGGLPADEAEAAARRAAEEEAGRGFDLASGPLLRARLLRLGPEEHELLLTMHHIISDGWSMGVFFRELGALYGAFSAGEPSPLAAPPIQYPDFAVWQREWLASPQVAQQLEYWKQHLRGDLPVLDLPTDRPRPLAQASRGAKHHLKLSPALTEELKKLSRGEGATLFMTLLAAFQTLLHRYTGQEDISVGTTVAGRNSAEVEDLIGCFLNTLALRTDLSGDPPFRKLLARVRDVTLKAYANQDVPVELLLEELHPERHLSHNPLFQVMLVLQNTPSPSLELRGLDAAARPVENGTAKFDLTLDLTEGPDGLEGWIEYDSELFDAATVARMAEHFQSLLAACTAQPDAPVSQLPLLAAAEREQLLTQWSQGGAREAGEEACVHRLVAAQAGRTPDAVALELAGERLTYRELDAEANRLAHYLRALGVGPEVPVGILLPRSTGMIVALLGVLKAGGAYVPLDPGSPAERLRLILEDSGARVLLTERELAAPLLEGGAASARVVCLDLEREVVARQSAGAPEDLSTPEAVAYVIYTSGSTGAPKGVAVEHRSLAGYTATARAAYELRHGDRVLQFASISFDASAEEIYPTLTSGATLVLRDELMISSVSTFLRACSDAALTVLDLPTAYWHEVALGLGREEGAELPPSLRLVIIGGERALPERFGQWREKAGRRVRLVNTYGPTEATIVATSCELLGPSAEGAGWRELPIGRPVVGAQSYVLDRRLQPVPAGVAGELYIGGEGVARGYLGRPALTAERFIPHPFATASGSRLYRTGDRVRFLPGGELEYLGRLDQQVKVRGFRIELGEIEAALYAEPSVRDALVMLREDAPGEKRLVAYVVPDGGREAGVSELRGRLAARLPQYMIPSAFVMLDELPMTPSGKVDRRALPAPDASRPELSEEFVPPRTPTEEVIAGVWAELLGVERVGVEDNFFDLGGHSLLATQAIARLRDALGVELPLRAFFETATVAALAELAERARESGGAARPPAVEKAPRDEALPLSFSQERLWFIAQLDPDNLSYNVPRALRVRGPLEHALLERTFTELTRRHEILRTTFPTAGGRPVQVIHESRPVEVPYVDLRALAPDEREAEVERRIMDEGRRPFDLARGPLIRITLLRVADDEHVLVLAEHHLIHDGWTQGVLMRDFTAIYSAFAEGRPSPLAELAFQYADFAYWQRRWLRGEVLDAQLEYWKGQLAGAAPVLEMPTDRPRPAEQTFRGAEFQQVFEEPLAEALRAFSRRHGVTLFMTMMAAFKALLYRYTGQEDISVGSGIANRRLREFENMLGMIINSLVIRTDLSGNPRFSELLGRVQEVMLGAYAHQDVPFERLVEELNPPRSLAHPPLFQMMFSFLDTPMSELEVAGLHFTPLEAHNRSAKFDLNVVVVTPAEQRLGLGGGRAARRDVTVLWEYNTDLFDEATVARLAGHYRNLVQAVLADAGTRLSDLPLMNESERRQLLARWDETRREYPRDGCLHELFEEQAARSPEAVAVSFGDERVSYAELNGRANRLARRLRDLGVGPEALVGVCAERSVEMVVALLAVLKAGGAYVPLDPVYPRERLAFMVEDAGLAAVLTQSHLAGQLPDGPAAVICLDEDEDDTVAPQAAENPRSGVQPDNLAYVIYTSGSTGRPKGVGVSHGNVTRLLRATHEWYGFGDADVWTLFHSYAFDFSVWEMWGALAYGGRLVVVPYLVSRSPEAFYELLCEERVTVLNQTPSAFRQLIQAEESAAGRKELSLRLVIFGGEALEFHSLRPWFERHGDESPRLVNMYGITETTVHVTYRPLGSEDAAQGSGSAIGVPIPDLQVYVLDRHLQPVPAGVPGELYVGGAGLARGYLNRPALTAERFIPDPFGGAPGSRLYKSGDLVRHTSDGDIEYIGRVDQQVKIRGFRVELGEVESLLCQHPQVREALVTLREDGSGQQGMVAYVVPEKGLARLPEGQQLYRLPDGVEVAHLNKNETEFLYEEIFKDETYLKHGVGLRDGDCVFDVGANIGLFTLFVGRRWPGVRTYAFEPMPPLCEILRANVALHGLNAEVFEVGLSDETTTADATFYPKLSIMSGIYADAEEDRLLTKSFLNNQGGLLAEYADELLEERFVSENFVCRLTTVSEVIRQHGIERIDLLKIDVEKSELNVLAGIEDDDWEKVKQVVVEVHDIDGRLARVREMLESRGFNLTVEQEVLLGKTTLYNIYAIHPSRTREVAGAFEASTQQPTPVPRAARALSARELREHLRERLPDYMVPAAFVLLDAMPLTPNGKVDRRALPAPGQGPRDGADGYVAPTTPAEQTLARVWGELLGVERVGVNDNFFESGGHSLLAAQFSTRVRAAFGVELPLRKLFEAPTIAQLARVIEEANSDGGGRPAAITPLPRQARRLQTP